MCPYFLEVLFFSEYLMLLLFIDILFVRHIIDSIALILQIITADAFMTPYEIGRKPDIRTIWYIFAIVYLIGFTYTDRVWNFTWVFGYQERVHDISYIYIAESTITNILSPKTYNETQVYIFAKENPVHVFTVFIGSKLESILHRYSILKCLEIRKKPQRKIILSCECRSVFPEIISELLYPLRLRIPTDFSISLIEIEYIPAPELLHKISKWCFLSFFLDEFLVTSNLWHMIILDIFSRNQKRSHVYPKEISSVYVLLDESVEAKVRIAWAYRVREVVSWNIFP